MARREQREQVHPRSSRGSSHASSGRVSSRSSSQRQSGARSPSEPSPRTTRSSSSASRASGSRTSGRSSGGREGRSPQGRAPQRKENLLIRILRGIGNAILFVLGLIGRFLRAIWRGLSWLFEHSKPAFVAVLLAALVAVGCLADFGSNYGRAYEGVSIGGLDVSGMDEEEIVALLQESYGEQLASGSATVYASEEAAAGEVTDDDAAIAEQQTAEEEAAGRTSWEISAEELSAYIPAQKLAEEALSVGRGESGVQERIEASRNGHDIEVYAVYGTDELEDFASLLDETLGEERIDWGFAVEDGIATVTEGSDGFMVDRDELSDELDEVFLFSEDGSGSFVAYAVDAPVRIDEEQAQEVCDEVNDCIADGARLVCNDGILELSNVDLGAWIVGEVEEGTEGYELVPHVDASLAKPSIVSFAKDYYEGDPLIVSFAKDSAGDVTVSVEGSATIPLADDAVEDLEEALFGAEDSSAAEDGIPVITIDFGECPDTMDFDEALDLGVIESVSSYTTEYSTGSGTENRNSNISLAASYLNNSIVEPGGSWSFNEVCGERSEERGFLEAGAIVDGEYDTDVGGGICQVATTVFNALYEAGVTITERHPHSLYISSYPEGRDAAVSWPDLDLSWENNTDSSLLLCVSCGDSTVTATLYGVDQGYEVSTEVGDWEEGEEYSTVTEVDEDLASGASYVETSGSDGREITVVRTVTDSNGDIVSEDTFFSSYGAIDEVIVVGPDTVLETEEDEAEEESGETTEESTEETAESTGDTA